MHNITTVLLDRKTLYRSFPSFGSQLKCPLLRETFPDHTIFKVLPPPLKIDSFHHWFI